MFFSKKTKPDNLLVQFHQAQVVKKQQLLANVPFWRRKKVLKQLSRYKREQL